MSLLYAVLDKIFHFIIICISVQKGGTFASY